MTPVARPNNIPILHDYLDFWADPLRFWLDVGRMGPIVRVQLGPARSFWVVTDADLFKEILLTKSKNYPRDRQIRNGNGIDGGNTVFNAQTYEEWRWRRRLLQPGFHRKELAKFAETMVAETERLAAELLDGDIVDLTKLMKKLTMRIICQTMFSASLEETDQLQEAFETSSEFSYSQMSAVVKTPVWLPTPMVQRTKAAVSTKYEVLGRIVDERLASGQPKGDMLDMLISTQLTQEDADEAMPGAGRSFDRDDLTAEMGSLVFAGHETTALTLTWLFYVLTIRPEISERVFEEVEIGQQPTVNSQQSTTNRHPSAVPASPLASVIGHLDQMTYTQQVIQETLRFYPPVYVTLREAEEDDQLGGYMIEKGTQLLMNIRGLHRDPRYWENPDQFDPGRFSPEKSAERQKFAYQPFISGPKKCIGDAFAMLEMRLIVPTLLRKIRFTPVSNEPAVEAPGFVMETAKPIMMKVNLLN